MTAIVGISSISLTLAWVTRNWVLAENKSVCIPAKTFEDLSSWNKCILEWESECWVIFFNQILIKKKKKAVLFCIKTETWRKEKRCCHIFNDCVRTLISLCINLEEKQNTLLQVLCSCRGCLRSLLITKAFVQSSLTRLMSCSKDDGWWLKKRKPIAL